MERDFHFKKDQIKKEQQKAREMGLTCPAAGVPEIDALYKFFGLRIRGRNFQSPKQDHGPLPEGRVRMELQPPYIHPDRADERVF
ncbi:MAG: hypothetical protein UX19_C0001G0023 [Candidatus Woesebacteria bacterium GW2011_GWA1_45_8]|uniref:Uncharacterized protein n=1 Tax=Candidatus Woesebacteria bacterium GW2011_GWA1_45_8 TaxID=1618559 RepID=A0A0G1MW00_9BACT|nr:MAG: hypothetical protein UX19_C0001G0023 [Candidatus Woesebacteria bacterium GW2011_GWA1_45_8]